MKKLLFLLPLLLAGCSYKQTPPEAHAAFWNRADMSSALYMRGPKAQHQLHMDISSCVSEVKELSRLGTIRDANPPAGIEMNVGLANKWQSPRGNGPLYTEFRDFHDFESCMNFKGWERTNYVKNQEIENARTNYRTTILGQSGDKTVKSSDGTHHPSRSGATGTYNN